MTVHLNRLLPPSSMTDTPADTTYLSVLLTVQVIVGVGHHQLLQAKRCFSIAVETTRQTVSQLIQLDAASFSEAAL